MRLKRLKIVLGVALILFVLVVANTIAFGLLSEKIAAPESKKVGEIKVLPQKEVVINNTSNNQVNQNNGVNTNNNQGSISNTQTVIVHKNTRTRAS